MKISGWPLGTAPASCMVMKSCDFSRHAQIWNEQKFPFNVDPVENQVFSNIFYENMNFFKENHSVKIMYFQLISCRKICILKGLPKVFIENLFLHISSRIHLLSVIRWWAGLISFAYRPDIGLLRLMLLSENFHYLIGVLT